MDEDDRTAPSYSKPSDVTSWDSLFFCRHLLGSSPSEGDHSEESLWKMDIILLVARVPSLVKRVDEFPTGNYSLKHMSVRISAMK